MSSENELAMFFDEDFSSPAYVDALFLSLAPSNPYTAKSLNTMSSKLLDLVTHLDYYSNELSSDLSKHLAKLQNASSQLSQSDDDTTRLQYYVNSLHNAVQSLHSDISLVFVEDPTPPVLEDLVLLRLVRQNLLLVLTLVERANLLVAEDTITVDVFQRALDELYDSLKERHDTNDPQLEQSIAGFVELLPLFNNVLNFYPVYKKFTNKLEKLQ